MKTGVAILSLIVPLLLLCNGIGGVAGGNTSDVGNGIVVGRVLQPEGTLANIATVRVVSADFIPEFDSTVHPVFPEVTVDTSGIYRFNGITSGTYTIEAQADTLGTIVDSVTVTDPNDTTVVPDAQLTGTGSVAGVSYLVGLDYYTQMRQRVYIKGTSFYAIAEYGGAFRIDRIPEGEYNLTVEPMPPWEQHTITIIITAGTTTELDTIYSNAATGTFINTAVEKGRLQ